MENYTHFSSLRVQGVVESSIQGKLLGSFDTMPMASALNSGQIILYTGATTGEYTKGKYYVSNGTAWVISDASPATVVVDSELSTTSTNPVQNKVITPVLNQLRTDVDSEVP